MNIRRLEGDFSFVHALYQGVCPFAGYGDDPHSTFGLQLALDQAATVAAKRHSSESGEGFDLEFALKVIPLVTKCWEAAMVDGALRSAYYRIDAASRRGAENGDAALQCLDRWKTAGAAVKTQIGELMALLNERL